MTSQYELNERRLRRMRTLMAVAERHTWFRQSQRAPGYRNPRHAIRTSNHEFDSLMANTPAPFDMLGLI